MWILRSSRSQMLILMPMQSRLYTSIRALLRFLNPCVSNDIRLNRWALVQTLDCWFFFATQQITLNSSSNSNVICQTTYCHYNGHFSDGSHCHHNNNQLITINFCIHFEIASSSTVQFHFSQVFANGFAQLKAITGFKVKYELEWSIRGELSPEFNTCNDNICGRRKFV